MNITGSWALDSEYTNTGLKSGKAFLSSSVTVSCRPEIKKGFGDYKEVRKAIEKTVAKEVDELYQLGFRGADLLTASVAMQSN
jgi:putative DNA methylase